MASAGMAFSMDLTFPQFRTLYRHSEYIQALCRFNESLQTFTCEGLDQELSDYDIDIQIPFRGHNTRAYFTTEQLCDALYCLAQSEIRPISVPRTISPVTLYHIGLFLQSKFLRLLALNSANPAYAADMIKSLLDIYSGPGDAHPDVTYLKELISHYTQIPAPEVIILAKSPATRVLRDQVRGALRVGTTVSTLHCLICSQKFPTIFLQCCHYPVHYVCLQERLSVLGYFQCRNLECNYLYDYSHADILPEYRYDPVKLTGQHFQPPISQCSNPTKDMFNKILDYFPELKVVVQHFRVCAQAREETWLNEFEESRPTIPNCRPG